MTNNSKITTNAGSTVPHYQDSLTVGPRGPVLLEDFFLHEKMAQFNRERIPERIVHAKGTGAFGKFVVTGDITKYSRAKIFSEIGKETKMFARFSTVGGEKGSADAERDPRGFALKFYTEDGNWDLVGNNTPVFFIKDAKKFPDFIHTQKRDPHTNCKSPTAMWDFWSLNPESLHQVLILMSDRGTPRTFRNMHGFGSHTFTLINSSDEVVYVKFHYKTAQGIENFSNEESVKMKGEDPDHAQRDLVNAIANGDFPRYNVSIQVMTYEQAKNFRWNPFDITKTWPQQEYPLIEVGYFELNQIPANYFRDVEQAAFSPSNVIDGIGFSPDKMLQGRILSYPDAQRYRIGSNYQDLPVNACPFMVNNYHRDGAMKFTDNGGASPNYFPNSFDGNYEDPVYKTKPYQLESNTVAHFERNENDDDHYTQPGILFDRVMSEQDRLNTISNIVGAMSGIEGPKRNDIIMRQLCHWFRASVPLGMGVAKGLGIDMQELQQHMPR
ncbi:catalase [Sphingobacterium paramultivorum]|uniref:catalase n=1 Tax=Sphingobacterium paramultivorum TaxID=2886510 RepID=A0A7G5DZH3_9SPHI|nr:catalase [Sphingobacterium paramultivorum]QMV67148.1 catalase [Sphingobacterium paramultivorum]WSO15996.1 catalase [Sphingobacterium paramultivorum]